MYLPYVYLITNKITNEFYYGSRYKNIIKNKTPEEDLWKEYFTSSKKISKIIKEQGIDIFDIKIITRYEDYDACFWHEQFLIKENIKNPLCLNQAYIDICHGVKFSTAGRKFTQEEIDKRDANKNPISSETRKKMSDAKKGKSTGAKSQITKDKISKSNKGKTRTEETKRNVANSKMGEKNPNFGKPKTEETKQRMKDGQAATKIHRSNKAKEFWAKPENRKKMMDARSKSNKEENSIKT